MLDMCQALDTPTFLPLSTEVGQMLVCRHSYGIHRKREHALLWLSLCSNKVIKLKGEVGSMERGQSIGTERNKHLRNHPEGASWKDLGMLAWPAAGIRPVLGNEEVSVMVPGVHKTGDNGFGGNCKISKEIWVCQSLQCVSKGNYRWPFPNPSLRLRIIRDNPVSKDKLASRRRWSFISRLRSLLLWCDSWYDVVWSLLCDSLIPLSFNKCKVCTFMSEGVWASMYVYV